MMKCQQLHVCITSQYEFGDCEGYARMRVGERLFFQTGQKSMTFTSIFDRAVCAAFAACERLS